MNEPHVPLASFQCEAIKWWKENGHQGVIALPFGLGSTLVARTALTESPTPVVTVVVCTTLSEVETMVDDLTGDAVVELSHNGANEESAKSRLEELQTNNLRSIVFVTTIQSWEQYELQSEIANLDEVTVQLFIPDADRVYDSHLASLSCLDPDRTLGISMIPEDRRDRFGATLDQDEMYDALFDKNLYSYSLVQAIEDRFLRPFNYYPIIARSKPAELTTIQDKLATAAVTSGESRFAAMVQAARTQRKAGNRVELISQLLQRNPPTPMVLICNEKHTGEQVLESLQNQGYRSSLLSSSLPPSERSETLEAYFHGETEYLVATVAALDMSIELDAIGSAVIVSSSKQGLAEYRCLNQLLMGSELKKVEYNPVEIYEIVTFPHEKATAENDVVERILRDATNLMRILIDASIDRHDTEYRLYRQLDEFGFGHLVYE